MADLNSTDHISQSTENPSFPSLRRRHPPSSHTHSCPTQDSLLPDSSSPPSSQPAPLETVDLLSPASHSVSEPHLVSEPPSASEPLSVSMPPSASEPSMVSESPSASQPHSVSEPHTDDGCHQPCSSTPLAECSEADEPLCRICLSGRDDEDPSLGRFIQPCLCRGTMAYIHVGCLQRWRTTSPSPRSFYRCDQCGYRYKLRRAKVAGLAENTVILGGMTFLVFFLLVILAGFVAGWLLESSQRVTLAEDRWDYGLGPFSYDSTGKIVGEVVGEAVRVLNSKLHVDGVSTAGGATVRAKRVADGGARDASAARLKAVQPDQGEPHSYRYVKAKSSKQSTGDRDGRSAVPTSATPRSTRASPDPVARDEPEQPGWLQGLLVSKLQSFAEHTIKGLAFIGVMSFFQLAMSVTLFSPWNFGIRNSVLRMMRSSHNRAGGRDPNGVASILVLIFVLLGLAKAIQGVWKCVRKVSQWVLRKIEDGVLDVGA